MLRPALAGPLEGYGGARSRAAIQPCEVERRIPIALHAKTPSGPDCRPVGGDPVSHHEDSSLGLAALLGMTEGEGFRGRADPLTLVIPSLTGCFAKPLKGARNPRSAPREDTVRA